MKDITSVNNVADLEFLTPGSVWTNEAGKSSRFLFQTNTHLPAEHQKRFPPQAIYADEEGNLYSVPVGRFVGRRTFYNVDPGLEARVSNLLALGGEDGSEEEFDLSSDGDDDTLVVDDDGDAASDVAPDEVSDTMGADQPDEEAAPQEPIVIFTPDRTDVVQIIPQDVLNANVQGYQQLPSNIPGELMHIILIRAADGITRDKLHACFSLNNKGITAVYDTHVNTPDGELNLVWDKFPGIFPCVYYGDSMYQMIFTTTDVLDYVVMVPADDPEFKATIDETGQTVIEAVPEPVVAAVPQEAEPVAQSSHVVVTHVNNIPVTAAAQ